MRKSLNSDISQFLTLVFLSFLLLFFDKLGFLRPVRSVLQMILVPVKSSLYSQGLRAKREISVIFKIRSLDKENQRLKKELAEAFSQLSLLGKLEEENRILREQFQLSQESDWQTTPAFVIGRNRFLQIDRGKRDGLKEGMAVVFKNILIGRVCQVTQYSSSVRLATDPDSKILAKTQNGAYGILSGRYQVGLVLEKVLPEKELSENDLVLTRGQEGIPSGLLLGKITKVQKVDSGLFQTAEVSKVLDFENLEIVFVTYLK